MKVAQGKAAETAALGHGPQNTPLFSCNYSGRSVGQTSGLPVNRASGPEFCRHQVDGAGGSVNRQAGGLPHT